MEGYEDERGLADVALIVQAVNEYDALRTIEKAIRPEHPGKPLTRKAEDAISAAISRLNEIRGESRDAF